MPYPLRHQVQFFVGSYIRDNIHLRFKHAILDTYTRATSMFCLGHELQFVGCVACVAI